MKIFWLSLLNIAVEGIEVIQKYSVNPSLWLGLEPHQSLYLGWELGWKMKLSLCLFFSNWGSCLIVTINIYVFLSVHTFILFIKYIYIQLWREKILDKALVDFWSHPWTKKHLQNTWWLMVKSWCTSLVVCYCLLLCVFCAMFVTSYTMTIVYVWFWNIFKIKN